MKIIGITGGIGTGKSTVTEYLISRGFRVLDADKISREIVEPGTETLRRLTEAFGEDILQPDGSLDRRGLAKRAFGTPEKEQLLNSIMHDKVLAVIKERIAEFKSTLDNYYSTGGFGSGVSITRKKALFVDAVLLYETGLDKYMTEVWVVDIDSETQLKRVMKRDMLSAEHVEKRMAAQMDREDRLARADQVLDNSGSREELYRQVDRLLNRL